MEKLGTKDYPWTENTEHQVEFIIEKLALTGKEHILDLACGFGRHSISLARKGFSVTGVDINKRYIDDAVQTAQEFALDTTFICADIRDVTYQNEFDVVLNLDDGAIGYLENDEENLKIFDLISKALKPGGKHFMGVNNADYAECHFPEITCEIGSKMVTIWQNHWVAEKRGMICVPHNIRYGEIAAKPPQIDIENESAMRIYSLSELEQIFQQRGMKVVASFANYTDKKSSDKNLVLNVYSIKHQL
jgi:SAM-dependent methyltransferase